MSVEVIAGIYFQKHRLDRMENINFGRILYSNEHHFCSIVLNGWRQCHAAAIPYDKEQHD